MAINTKKISVYMIVGVLLAAAIIAAVYSSGLKLPSSGSNNGVILHPGTLIVSIKDAPVDVKELWVKIDSIDVNSDENGWKNIPVQLTKEFDLLTLKESSLDLAQAQLDPGNYSKVRIHVSSARALLSNDEAINDLKVPSGKIDVIISFEIKEGGSTNVLIDMTADWIAISTSHNLRPVLKATVSYAPEPSNGVQQATSTQTPDQTEAPTATPTAPVESPPVESPTPTATAPTESPTATPSTPV